MAFLLYDVKSTGAGKHYTLIENIRLAGSNGPLAAIHNSKNPTKKKSFTWHASDAEILQNIEGAKSEQEFVIDLKPNAKGNLSLYRLLDVWGFSYDNWTPLALRLECLFVDEYRDDSEEFKKSFLLPLAERDFVGEFLFVQGGTEGGTWNWGPAGRVNGALLWRDAFDYLTGELSKVL